MEHEEEFEARQSISSRGRDTRTHMMPGQQRDTQLKPNVRETTYQPQRNSPQEDRYVEGEMDEYGEGEDSVIEEIVDEQVVEIESGDEEQYEGRQEDDGGIDQYLDNIKQEDYAAAAKDLDSILRIDPNYAYAKVVREVVEKWAIQQANRDLDRERRNAVGEVYSQVNEEMIFKTRPPSRCGGPF